MHLYMCICKCVYIIHIYLCDICIYMYLCIYIQVYIYLSIYLSIYLFIYLSIYLSIMYVYIYIQICYVRIHIRNRLIRSSWFPTISAGAPQDISFLRPGIAELVRIQNDPRPLSEKVRLTPQSSYPKHNKKIRLDPQGVNLTKKNEGFDGIQS